MRGIARLTAPTTAALCLLLACGSGSWADGRYDAGKNAAVGEEIWRAEQAYVKRLEAGDVDGLAGFWHPDFAGWPSHAGEPLGIEAGEISMRELLARIRLSSVRIRPLATRTRGDVVIVHYMLEAEVEAAGAEQRASRYRITHTWVRNGAAWRILGGMSAEIAIDE